MDAAIAFRDDMQASYGPLDLLPIPDGSIRRFHVPGDKVGTLNGWYLLFPDGIASGCFGSWKEGCSHTWSSRKPADYLEAQLIRQRIDEAKRQREAEQHHRNQNAAEQANRLWRGGTPPDWQHPYLKAKQIKPHGLRQSGDVLLVPLNYAGQLVNLQRIHPDGNKRFLYGGMVKGCYSPLGNIEAGQPLYVCEGLATGASIHEATGHAVACAMNAGNLLPVGQYLQRRRADTVLIIAGDDDRQTEGNPGRTAANKAATALGCGVVFPSWPDDAPLTLTDFNDLATWRAEQ
jgi:putative DNA primase/helicase